MLEDFAQSWAMVIDFPLLHLLIEMLQLSGCLHLTWVPFSTTTSVDSFKTRNLDSTQTRLSHLSFRSKFAWPWLKTCQIKLSWVMSGRVLKLWRIAFFFLNVYCLVFLVSLLCFVVFYFFSLMFVSVVTCLTVVMVTKRYFRMWLDYWKRNFISSNFFILIRM